MQEIDFKPEEIASKLNTSSTVISGELVMELQRESKRQELLLRNQENRDILLMRRMWGNTVLLLIAVIVVFDIFLVVLYGLKILSFDDSNVVIAVVVDGLLKIVGLGYLITENIFKKIFL